MYNIWWNIPYYTMLYIYISINMLTHQFFFIWKSSMRFNTIWSSSNRKWIFLLRFWILIYLFLFIYLFFFCCFFCELCTWNCTTYIFRKCHSNGMQPVVRSVTSFFCFLVVSFFCNVVNGWIAWPSHRFVISYCIAVAIGITPWTILMVVFCFSVNQSIQL